MHALRHANICSVQESLSKWKMAVELGIGRTIHDHYQVISTICSTDDLDDLTWWCDESVVEFNGYQLKRAIVDPDSTVTKPPYTTGGEKKQNLWQYIPYIMTERYLSFWLILPSHSHLHVFNIAKRLTSYVSLHLLLDIADNLPFYCPLLRFILSDLKNRMNMKGNQ